MNTRAQTLSIPCITLGLIAVGCDLGPAEGPQERADQEIRRAGDSTQDRTCWSDRDCGDREICRGARICPPGALCGPLPDQPGSCVSPEIYCEQDGARYRPGESFGPCNACECQSDGTIACRDFVCLECRSDEECPEGYACQLPSDCPPDALCRPIADAPGYCMPSVPGPSSACTPEACGPAPLMPNRLCDDGIHFSGPSGQCLRGEDGTCYHEILSCPNCGSETCEASELCLRSIDGAPTADGESSVEHRCLDAGRYMICDGADAATDVLPGLHLSCGCLDLGSLCDATATCEDDTGTVRVTCSGL